MNNSDYFSYYAAFFLVILVLIYHFINSKKNSNLPPGPFNLPLLGYLPFLGKYPHLKLTELSQKYGNIFCLRLGTHPVVVLADFEVLKEAFSKSETLDRPLDAFEGMPDGLGLTSSNGTEWTEQRKFTMKAMRDLGLGKNKWENFIQDELNEFIHILEKQEGQPFDVKSALVASVANNMFSLIFGYRLPHDHPKMQIIINAVYSFPSLFTPTGSILKLLKRIGINYTTSAMKDIFALNQLIHEEINSKKKNTDEVNENCFVISYLRKMDEENLKKESLYNEANLVGNIQTLIFGGTETTVNTLSWLIFGMATNPKIQEKIHEEIDNILGRTNKPQWTEHSKFPYTYATILEGMRWRAVVPLNLLRCTNEDVKISGYDIPKNTLIIGLLWAIQRDSKIWKDPERFIPDRFIDADGTLITKQDGFVPFSYGKRFCPGEAPAMMEIFLYFTTLMQKFTILSPANTKQPLDLDGIINLILTPKRQKLRFVLRM